MENNKDWQGCGEIGSSNTALLVGAFSVENNLAIPQKLPYDPIIPRVDIQPKELKTDIQTTIWMLTFIAKQVTTAPKWKQLK